MMDPNTKAVYEILYNRLRQEILTGIRPIGGKLPSENALAREYGVSRHTVRKVFSALICDGLIETRPGKGTFARAPGRRRSGEKEVMVILPIAPEDTLTLILRGIYNELEKRGFQVKIYNTENSQSSERTLLESAVLKRVSGLIIYPSKSEYYCQHMNQYERLDQEQIPYVFLIDTYPKMRERPHIFLNDQRGAYLAARYLLTSGHRNVYGIFKIDGHRGRSRYQGFVQAMKEFEAGYQPEKILMYRAGEEGDFLNRLFRTVFEQDQKIDGLVCYNNEIAWLAMRILNELGKKVPKDISVISTDDFPNAPGNEYPRITAIIYPKSQVGKLAAWILLEQIYTVPSKKSRIPAIEEPELRIGETSRRRKNSELL